MKTVLKVLTALAAIAGVVYVIAAYGDKIVAWCKKLLASCPCHCCNVVEEEADFADEATPAEEAPAEEPAAEEAPAAEAEAAEEVPAEEPAVDETAPIADEADFEG